MGIEDAHVGLGITEAVFVGLYGAREVRLGAVTMTLASALAAEQEAREEGFCTASDEEMADPAIRLGYLARILDGAGSLEEAHRYLLPPAKPDESAS